jgi:glucose-1-phosphate thymidylyltransferase
MKIVIPMAGIGKRMRPHTFTTPKPLLPIMGKPIVELLIRDIAKMYHGKVEEVAFIIGDFGEKVEEELKNIAIQLGYAPKIYYQDEALGTAHALYCAKESLCGNVLVAFADTLFSTDFTINTSEDAIIWTKRIPDPSLFGVVVPDKDNYITRFAEKSKEFVSDLAIIGIYYFREGEVLRDEIKYLLDNHVMGNGEYQLTDALDNMRKNGKKLKIAMVNGWFDCGNKDAMVSTNKEMLEINKSENMVSDKAVLENATIIPPCFIAGNVRISNSIVGPYVSVGQSTHIGNSIISESIILSEASIHNAVIKNSMIGSHSVYDGHVDDVNISDYSTVKK